MPRKRKGLGSLGGRLPKGPFTTRTTIHTGGEKVEGLKFMGELMTCCMCGKEQQSDPKVESDWTYVEADGEEGYYVCPGELQAAHEGRESYEAAWGRILLKIAELGRERGPS